MTSHARGGDGSLRPLLGLLLEQGSLADIVRASLRYLAEALPSSSTLAVSLNGETYTYPDTSGQSGLPEAVVSVVAGATGGDERLGVPFAVTDRVTGRLLSAVSGAAGEPHARERRWWVVLIDDPKLGSVGWLAVGLPGAETMDAGQAERLGLVVDVLCLAARQAVLCGVSAEEDDRPCRALPDRHWFVQRLSEALARARGSGATVAVLVCGFDRLRLLNHGLDGADEERVVTELIRRVRERLRRGDLLARVDSASFGVLLEEIEGERDATAVAERIAEALREPVRVDSHEFLLAAGIGVASGQHADTAEELLRQAEVALANARSVSGGDVRVFNERLARAIQRRSVIEGELARALQRGEFALVFQPVVDLELGRLAHLEALLRWRHHRLGEISPAEFVPVAEQTGLITAIGDWVVRQAACLMRSWLDRHPGLPDDLRLSVNLSPRQLERPTLVQEVVAALADAGLPPQRLTLEITESCLVDPDPLVVERLQAFRALGIELALDDFGAGYSSLGYLSRLPVDAIKIDRRFVERLGQDSAQTSIVQGIVSVARALGLGVVGEGIETEAQLVHVQALGCRCGQGFYLARPMTAEQVDALLSGDPAVSKRWKAARKHGLATGVAC